MKFREKLLILFVAVTVSVFGFNLIASPFLCLLKVDKEASYETIKSYLAKCDAYPIHHIDDRVSLFDCLNPYSCISLLR